MSTSKEGVFNPSAPATISTASTATSSTALGPPTGWTTIETMANNTSTSLASASTETAATVAGGSTNTATMLTATAKIAPNSAEDTKNDKEDKEITIVLMGGFHSDPSPYFFLSQYINQNRQKIRNAGIKIVVGTECEIGKGFTDHIEVDFEIIKIYQWLKQTRLLEGCTRNILRFTTAEEIAEFIISNTNDKHKKFFLEKLAEDCSSFFRFIDFRYHHNDILARKALTSLIPQLIENDIEFFALESHSGIDYVEIILKNLFATGNEEIFDKFEDDRIKKMVESMGKHIKRLKATGGLIAVPSLGLAHMHRLEAHVKRAFKDSSIKIKSFEVSVPVCGILVRYNNGNEKHWLETRAQHVVLESVEKIKEKVDSEEIKKYYRENPHSKILIGQKESGEFYDAVLSGLDCTSLSELLDSIILNYSRLSLNSTISFAPKPWPIRKTYTALYEPQPLETTSIIKWRNYPADRWLGHVDNSYKGMIYEIQLGIDKDSKIAIYATQYGYSEPGELWVGVCSGVGKPILTLLKLYKKKGEDFYIGFPSLDFFNDDDTIHSKIKAKFAILTTESENGCDKIHKGKQYREFTYGPKGEWVDDQFYPPEVYPEKTLEGKNPFDIAIGELKAKKEKEEANKKMPITPAYSATTSTAASIVNTLPHVAVYTGDIGNTLGPKG